VAGLPPDCL